MTTTTIPARFNGPPNSGNGGYSCGVLANAIIGPAVVRLHIPPPLDTPMDIRLDDEGTANLFAGATLVGTAKPRPLDLPVPKAPSLAQASRASEGFPCYHDHIYPSCFVCGPKRNNNDGLCLFPGPVEDWNLLACPWRLTADLLDHTGQVRPEIVWAALDCPGYFAATGKDLLPTLLGELHAELHQPVPGDAELVVFSWPLGRAGRKLYGGTAVANQAGTILARSHSTWIELKS